MNRNIVAFTFLYLMLLSAGCNAHKVNIDDKLLRACLRLDSDAVIAALAAGANANAYKAEVRR